MTLTLEPTSHEIDVLRREAKRRGMAVEKLVPLLLVEAIEDLEYPHHEPNEETIAAMDELDNGGGVRFSNIDDLFNDLGIPCEK